MFEISIPTHFRYELIQPKEEVKSIVYILHGYGQLVKYFSSKFVKLQLSNALLVFPEGKHRFYVNGVSGRVGASWMTKEWREDDIDFNVFALDSLNVILQKQFPNIQKTTIVGFSQGGATAARWATMGQVNCNHFISWASIFPPDIQLTNFDNVAKNTTFVVGNQDEYFPELEREKQLTWYRQLGADTVVFEGKHEIHLETLKQLL